MANAHEIVHTTNEHGNRVHNTPAHAVNRKGGGVNVLCSYGHLQLSLTPAEWVRCGVPERVTCGGALPADVRARLGL